MNDGRATVSHCSPPVSPAGFPGSGVLVVDRGLTFTPRAPWSCSRAGNGRGGGGGLPGSVRFLGPAGPGSGGNPAGRASRRWRGRIPTGARSFVGTAPFHRGGSPSGGRIHRARRVLHRVLQREVVPGGSSASGRVVGGRKRRVGVSIASLGFSVSGTREPYAADATGTVVPRRGGGSGSPPGPETAARTGRARRCPARWTRRMGTGSSGNRPRTAAASGGASTGGLRISSGASIPPGRVAQTKPVAAAFATSVSAVSPGSKENADRRRPPARVPVRPRSRPRRGPLRPVEPAGRNGGRRYPARRMRRMGTGSFRICPCTTSTSVGASVGSSRIASSTSRPRTTRPKVA